MAWDIARVMDLQHRRVEWLLLEALGDHTALNVKAYLQFRAEFLRHIGIEEKVLLAALKAERVEWGQARRVHVEHAAFGALLAGEPDLAVAHEVARLLEGHVLLEEGVGGLFDTCATHLDAEPLVVGVHAYPKVQPAPWSRARWIPRTIDAALALAEGRVGPPHEH